MELWLDLGGWQSEAFEDAIRALATQSRALHRRGIGVRFRSQECEIVVPGHTGIYGLLKYLALTEYEPLARPFPALNMPEKGTILVYAATRERVPEALQHRAVCAGESV